MLYRTLISPSVFSSLPKESRSQDLFCNAVNGCLLDLLENGVIVDFLDGEQSVAKLFQKLVDDWPIKRKQKVRELIKKLEKKSRFATIPVQHKDFDTEKIHVKSNLCESYIMLLDSNSSIPLITGQNCCIESCKTSMPTISVIDIDNYSDSQLAQDLRRAKTENNFGSGDITKYEFEKKILIPVFRDAKHIKIFDRYIGRSLLDNYSGNIRVSRHLKGGYRKTLEWMIEVFFRETSHRMHSTFEIYTGIDKIYDLSETDIQDIESAFQSFHNYLNKKYSIEIKFFVKKEKHKDINSFKLELRHQRYIITEQVGLSIDRGCDLLLNDLMRDVSVSFISKTDAITRDTNKLEDLLLIPRSNL